MTIWSRMRNPQEPTLTVHAGSTRKRDTYKAAAAGLTGVTAFGALTVTGAVAGAVAHEAAVKKHHEVQASTIQAVPRRRAYRTVVRTRIVHMVSTSGVGAPGSGGLVSTWSGNAGSGNSNGSAAAYTPRQAPAAPRPAPPPAPARTSGS